MSDLLAASERVRILRTRLSKLQSGGGEYSPKDRAREIADCADCLIAAESEYRNAMRGAH